MWNGASVALHSIVAVAIQLPIPHSAFPIRVRSGGSLSRGYSSRA
ncbi:hypothetical protein PLANPX_0564 [Lacipirellula parvula]|uniref:Uncharacterized protein n=1 Tax=Lacipirellula parvula TaxID=2650471 RepID=A0A5K7X547_9BACT|nr:hypothetical protein PLANPX_0564 [Lacipirellula parvula]